MVEDDVGKALEETKLSALEMGKVWERFSYGSTVVAAVGTVLVSLCWS